MRSRLVRILLLVLAASALAGTSAPTAGSHHLKMIVGVTDDSAKWLVSPARVVAVHHDLRLMAVRVTIPWRPPEVRPTPLQQIYLQRIWRLVESNDRIVLAVYNVARYAPTTPATRNDYCAFLRGVLRRMPLIQDYEIWNEANNPAYWPETAGAAAYEALLARCWDLLHASPGRMNVISSTAPHHDPADFILDLGASYRISGRARPIFDTFGHNPYPENSAEPPSATHPDTGAIDEGDYPMLMALLATAFGNSGQPVPGQKGVGVWYVEDGFQTVPPAGKRRFYHGRESDRFALPAVAPTSVDPAAPRLDQATQLRDAILLAFCQPAVTGFLNFGLVDEDRLGGWQSGLLYRDGTRKPSYDTFKAAIAAVRAKQVDCSKVHGAPPPAVP